MSTLQPPWEILPPTLMPETALVITELDGVMKPASAQYMHVSPFTLPPTLNLSNCILVL